MSDAKLVIGRIPYANVFPIFYVLEHEADCSQYTFVEGVPSQLNRMLREGEVDVSPSSSLEYLRDPGRYGLIGNHSISSRGPVGSIFLFSPRPVEELDGKVVYASSQSETSVVLLKIVLGNFYGLSVTVETVPNPVRYGAAFLLIGDDALKYGSEVGKRGSAGLPGFGSSVLVYDLGEIWYRQTGLPFVFALWMMRNSIPDKKGLVDKFVGDLDKAKKTALKKLPEIARHAPIRSFMTKEEILSYWKKLDYEFSEEHVKGLALFDRYRKELS
ncbi:MAG: menaquinone biosynthesis protein [Nitrospirae bacterium]|nr:menaquinone biosynthesis protein [Nitrospirota bacterium]